MVNKILDMLAVMLVASSVVLTGCVTRTVQPDGSVVVEQLDTDTIKLMATASVAAWAASQKDGIRSEDAATLVSILNAVRTYHLDGTRITPAQWTPAVQREVPRRYQALAMVLIELVAHELEKRGLSEVVPTVGSDAEKVMHAIYEGAMVGLRPYLQT